MKFENLSMIAILTLILTVSFFSGCVSETTSTETSTDYKVYEGDYMNPSSLLQGIEKQDLSEEEKNGLIQMREEEKLARDVYLTLGEKWGLRIFYNIAQSEQTHTDSVKALLDRYGIKDPVEDDSVGSFTSPEMKQLYETLVEKGSNSLLDALEVGATIEDLDIKDLEEFIAQSDNEDIHIIYENLMRGSRNHLRAYYRMIQSNGGNYTPQYISQEEFESIINTPQERGIE